MEEEIEEYMENEVYKNLRIQNLKPKVAAVLVELFGATDVTAADFDDRAIELLRSFNEEHALFVIKEVDYSYISKLKHYLTLRIKSSI